nr:TrmB family transcriptional regulator [Brevibacillus laterosporus]
MIPNKYCDYHFYLWAKGGEAVETIYSQLHKLGFSQYESKAYVSLIQQAPATGYEVSKRSGVPRSMIYEVLGKLIDRGAAYLVPTDPVKYAPVPAKQMLERLRNNMEETIHYLEHSLETLEKDPAIDVIMHLSGYDHVIQELSDTIHQAKSELWLSIWEPQVSELYEQIQQAVSRDISVFSIVFGAEGVSLGYTFPHNYMSPEVVQERMGGQLTIVARDGEEVIIANFNERGVPWAIKTRNPALVLVATEYVRHDIMIEEVTREYGADKVERLWRNRPDLSHVVTGYKGGGTL